MDLTVKRFETNVGLQVLEGFLFLAEKQMALCSVQVSLEYFFLPISVLRLRFFLQFLAQAQNIAEVHKCFFDFPHNSIDQSSEVKMFHHVIIRIFDCFLDLLEGHLEVTQTVFDGCT